MINKTRALRAFQSAVGRVFAKPKNCPKKEARDALVKCHIKIYAYFARVDVRETAKSYRECSAVADANRGRSGWPRCPKVISSVGQIDIKKSSAVLVYTHREALERLKCGAEHGLSDCKRRSVLPSDTM